MRRILNFILSQINFEESVIMTIFERLAAIDAKLAALESTPVPVADTSALEARIAALEAEVGQPPADPAPAQ